MTTILEFIFMDFWHFVGCLLLVETILTGTANIIEAIARLLHRPKSNNSDLAAYRAGCEMRKQYESQ